jgi:hypothetical protein
VIICKHICRCRTPACSVQHVSMSDAGDTFNMKCGSYIRTYTIQCLNVTEDDQFLCFYFSIKSMSLNFLQLVQVPVWKEHLMLSDLTLQLEQHVRFLKVNFSYL